LFSHNDSSNDSNNEDDYVVWKVERGQAINPLSAPASLPPTISYDDTNIKRMLSASYIMNAVSKATSSVSTLPRQYYSYDVDDTINNKDSSNEDEEETGKTFVLSQEILRDRIVPSSAYLSEPSLAGDIASSEKESMIALQAYLRHLETEGDTAELNAEEREYIMKWKKKLGAAIPLYDAPATPDGCFPAIFNRSLSLGVVSRRRVYSEAMALLHQLGESEMPPPPGLLARLSWLLTSHGGTVSRNRKQQKAQAAALAAEAGDFHVMMAGKREGKVVHGGAMLGHWRWRGILSDYLYSNATDNNIDNNNNIDAPAVLLVHGFGAFSEHYRSNVQHLASKGYAVYAPTLPGYGRSEKPTIAYGQDLWRDYLADFVKNVVKKPVVVVGNSIGGFMSASLAADYPGLASGVVLLNSAGQLMKDYSPPLPDDKSSGSGSGSKSKGPPQAIVGPVSSALFRFLEGGVEKQLKRVYPVNPNRADAWLAGEISRAAKDPGALGVFRSVFYLPKPRALNYLLDEFGGPVMVLQGALDPLNDAKGRAAKLGELTKAKVVLLNAGHCPHDEVPEEVNAELEKFLKGISL
jgi:pimeloyl-ACP methyl ester carboxylesterase